MFKVTNEKIVVQFEHKADQYFFNSKATSHEDYFEIEIPEKIYKIQRRNDFRVTIPYSISPILKIKKIPDLKAEIIDISLGGIKFNIKTQLPLDLKKEEQLNIQIKIMDFEEADIGIIIKFLQFNAAENRLTVGCQFAELDLDQTSTLRNTLIQIDRILRGKTEDEM